MFRAWKKCVQTAHKLLDKSVGSHPQVSHRSVAKPSKLKVIRTFIQLYPEFTPPHPTYLSTRKYTDLTDRKMRLYPSSTEPITITTTYI